MASRDLSIILRLQDQVSGELQGIQTNIQALQPTFRKMAMVGTAGFAAIAGGVGLAVREFASFEDAMVKSLAIMGNVSDEMRDTMVKTARDVAKETTFSAEQAAASYFYLASAGLDAAQSMEALPKVAQFAQAGAFDMALATDLLTDAQSALGLTVDDTAENMLNMSRVSDVLVKANTLANATVQQFSESLTTRGAAALRLVNKDMEEGIALLAAWADQGVKGAEAGNRLDIVLRDLQNAALKNVGEFKNMNIEVFDAQGNLRNIADIIGDMEGAFDGMSDSQLRSSLSMLGFTDRSIAATASLLGTSGQIKEYEQNLRNAGGTTEEVANKQLESFSAQMALLGSSLKDIAITIGNIFAPTILSIVDAISPVIEKIGEWVENNKTITKVIIIVSATVFALIAMIGFLGLAFIAVMKISAMYSGALIAAGITTTGLTGLTALATKGILILNNTIKGLAIFLATNPLGVLLLAIGVIIVALAKFGDEVGGMKNAWHLTCLQMRENFWSFIDSVVDAINKVAGKIPGISKIADSISASVKKNLKSAQDEFNALNKNIAESQVATKDVDDVMSELGGTMDNIVIPSIKDVSTNFEGLEEKSEDLTLEIEKVADAYKNFSKVADDALFNLSESHQKTMNDFNNKINGIRENMSKLRSDFAKTESSDRKSIAGSILSAQDDVAKIEEQIAKETSQAKIDELQLELEQKKAILTENADFIKQFEAEITEARRREGLTDLQRAIEDYNAKRAAATNEFNHKMSLLRQEMRETRRQRSEERDLYRQKVEFIQEQNEELSKHHEKTMEKNLLVTKEKIEAEIEMYRRLAAAISEARGSSNVRQFDRAVGGVTSVNDAIITPQGQIIQTDPADYLIATKRPQDLAGGGINITITGNTFMGEDDLAEKVGDKILDIFKHTTKLSYANA